MRFSPTLPAKDFILQLLTKDEIPKRWNWERWRLLLLAISIHDSFLKAFIGIYYDFDTKILNFALVFQITDDKLFEQGIDRGINFDKFDNIPVIILL